MLPAYLAWWINQSPAQAYLQSQAGESSISYISVKNLSSLMVKIPSLEVQGKIVKAMELWQREKELYALYEHLKNKIVNAICIKSTEE